MAFAVTSNTGTVTPVASTFEIVYGKENYQHHRIMVYISYTKDTETDIKLKMARKDNITSAYFSSIDYFFEPIDDGTGLLTEREFTINASSDMVIPVQLSKVEDELKIIITPQDIASNGTVQIEFRDDLLEASGRH